MAWQRAQRWLYHAQVLPAALEELRRAAGFPEVK
jgi:hypothetical protein